MKNINRRKIAFAALTGYDDIIRQTAQSSDDAVERANRPVDLAEGYLSA